MLTLIPHKCLRCWRTSRRTRWNTQVRAYLCTDEAPCFARARAEDRYIEERVEWPQRHNPIEDTLEFSLDDTLVIPVIEDKTKPKWDNCDLCSHFTDLRWSRNHWTCRACRTVGIVYDLAR